MASLEDCLKKLGIGGAQAKFLLRSEKEYADEGAAPRQFLKDLVREARDQQRSVLEQLSKVKTDPNVISQRDLRTLDGKVQRLREAGAVDRDTLDDLDWLLESSPGDLRSVFAEAESRAAMHNEQASAGRNEWTAAFGSDSAKLVKLAKRMAARDGNAIKHFDEIVDRVGQNPDQFPEITAAAEQIGGGNLESGLFQLAQESRKYFRNKTADDFVAGAARDAVASRNKPQETSERLEEEFGAFSGLPVNIAIDLGEAGKAAGRGLAATKKWLQKNFTSAGLANQDIKRLNDRRAGRVQKHLTHLRFLQKDLDRQVAVRRFGLMPRKISPEFRQKLDAALKGQETDLPANILAAIEPMRAQVDALSDEFIKAGIGNEDLQLTIEENKGVYLTRTYRKHQDRGWAEKARSDPELMAQAKAALAAEYPADSASDIQWRINMLLDRDSLDSKDIPEKFHKDAKFWSVLEERKDLPEWIRNLYGENLDPWLNHILTVGKMAQLLAHHEMMGDLKQVGLASGFLSTPDQKLPENFRRISSAKNRLLEPLDGLYTDPDTLSALDSLTAAKPLTGLFRWLTVASMLAKWNVTVGNSKSYLRNFLGNPAFALANGDIGTGDFGQAIKATYVNFVSKKDAGQRAYLERAAELGLVDSDIGVGEIKAMMGDLADAGPAVMATGGNVARGVKRGMDGLGRLYQSMDLAWKLNGWESKKRYYQELHPNASQAEVEQLAADDVKAHYPTYSEVPAGVKAVNRLPLFGNFLSFRSEVIRTLKNNVVTINRELGSESPVARSMGRKRAVGLVTSLAAISVLSEASKMMWGVSNDKDKNIRKFQAPWTRNSPYLYLGQLANGAVNSLDLGFMDPRSQFIKPIYALLGPGTTQEKVEQAFSEVLDPLDEDILFSRVLSVMRNKTPDGRQVFNDAASRPEKARRIRDYLGEVLLPATVAQFERVQKARRGEISAAGKPYDMATEIAGLIGFRATPVDVRQSFSFRSNDLRKSIRDAESGIRSQLLQRGTVQLDESARLIRDFQSQRDKSIAKWHDLAMSAIRLGVPAREVRTIIFNAADSRRLTEMIMSGVAGSYQPSPETLREVIQRPNGRGRVQFLAP